MAVSLGRMELAWKGVGTYNLCPFLAASKNRSCGTLVTWSVVDQEEASRLEMVDDCSGTAYCGNDYRQSLLTVNQIRIRTVNSIHTYLAR